MSAEQHIHFLPPVNHQPQAPIFIYFPGMDGTGKLLRPQIPSLERSFEVWRLSIPVDDLTDWEGMVTKIVASIEGELSAEIPRRPIYLCGESFGGCLALKLAIAAPHLCDRLILVNPASSFKQQPWLRWGRHFSPLLPVQLYPLSCLVLLPFLATLERIDAEDRDTLLQVMQALKLSSVLWRMSLLDRFDINLPQLQTIQAPTLVISSGQDRLLPSIVEGQLLTRWIPRSRLHLIPQGGHAVLLERDVDLHTILQQQKFLPDREAKNTSVTLSQC